MIYIVGYQNTMLATDMKNKHINTVIIYGADTLQTASKVVQLFSDNMGDKVCTGNVCQVSELGVSCADM